MSCGVNEIFHRSITVKYCYSLFYTISFQTQTVDPMVALFVDIF